MNCRLLLTINDIDMSCITETWFREYMDDTSLALEGFCLERKDRDHRRGGGVGLACYIRNDIEYNRLRELEDDVLEVLWIKVMPRRLTRHVSMHPRRMFILHASD